MKSIIEVKDLSIKECITFIIFHFSAIIALCIISAIILKYFGIQCIVNAFHILRNYKVMNILILTLIIFIILISVYILFIIFKNIFNYIDRINLLIRGNMYKCTLIDDGKSFYAPIESIADCVSRYNYDMEESEEKY